MLFEIDTNERINEKLGKWGKWYVRQIDPTTKAIETILINNICSYLRVQILVLDAIHEQGGGQATSRLYGVDQKKVGTHLHYLKKCYIAFMFWVISRGSAI